MGNQEGKASALNSLSDYIDQLAKDHGDVTLSPDVANDVKSSMDKTIKYARNTVLPTPSKEAAFRSARNTDRKSVV